VQLTCSFRGPGRSGITNYTVRQAARDWLANGLAGRSAKTVKKNQNVLEPILSWGGRLAEPDDDDLRAAGRSFQPR
jgi:hypothetical protein